MPCQWGLKLLPMNLGMSETWSMQTLPQPVYMFCSQCMCLLFFQDHGVRKWQNMVSSSLLRVVPNTLPLFFFFRSLRWRAKGHFFNISDWCGAGRSRSRRTPAGHNEQIDALQRQMETAYDVHLVLEAHGTWRHGPFEWMISGKEEGRANRLREDRSFWKYWCFMAYRTHHSNDVIVTGRNVRLLVKSKVALDCKVTCFHFILISKKHPADHSLF